MIEKIRTLQFERSLMRIVVSIMMDINEEWITGKLAIVPDHFENTANHV